MYMLLRNYALKFFCALNRTLYCMVKCDGTFFLKKLEVSQRCILYSFISLSTSSQVLVNDEIEDFFEGTVAWLVTCWNVTNLLLG